jgi:lipoyl(octanoyl) transferase
MARPAYLMNLGQVPYLEAWDLQRSLAGAVSQGAIPDTVLLLEHPPVVTLGRRTDTGAELHVPEGAAVEVVETNRGGKSTYHGPGQLVCYPILDLNRHGRDVKRFVRDLEDALIRTLEAVGVTGERIEGLTGVWLTRPPRYASGLAERPTSLSDMPPLKLRGGSNPGPRKIGSIGVHVSRWVTTHGYALNVDLDPAPFSDWITACGLEDAAFTTIARELGRPVTVDDVRPHAAAALEEVYDLAFEELPADDGHGLWAQPIHAQLATK